ncbi:hypothetical protein BJX70DRAFT_365836 [Aspergillus crustosus]
MTTFKTELQTPDFSHGGEQPHSNIAILHCQLAQYLRQTEDITLRVKKSVEPFPTSDSQMQHPASNHTVLPHERWMMALTPVSPDSVCLALPVVGMSYHSMILSILERIKFQIVLSF